MLFATSFFLFSLTAERVAEAVNEKNVQKRIAYMLLYNVGVTVLFIGGALVIANISSPKISISVLLSYIPLQPQATCILIIITIIIYIRWWQHFWACLMIALLVLLVSLLCQKHAWWVPAALLSIPWVSDIIWLIFSGNKDFQGYFGIEGNIKPPSDCKLWVYIFYKIRSFLHRGKSFPHDDVYARLQNSPIHGVGVFAIRDIPRGTKIFRNDDSKMIWINKADIGNIDTELLRLYDDFSISKKGKLGCPKNFNMLTVGWYINESKGNPNVSCNDDYDFVALRDIKKGEELTSNYSTYSEHPKGLLSDK